MVQMLTAASSAFCHSACSHGPFLVKSGSNGRGVGWGQVNSYIERPYFCPGSILDMMKLRAASHSSGCSRVRLSEAS